MFKHIPPVDGSAEGFDEYGRVYRYKCGFRVVGKQQRKIAATKSKTVLPSLNHLAFVK